MKKNGASPQQELTKHQRWLRFFFDDSNPTTFLNATQSAKSAGYCDSSYQSLGVEGHRQLKKAKAQLVSWLNDEEWTEEKIKFKFLQLLEAKKVERFAHQGQVVETHIDEDRGIQFQAAKFVAKLLKMEPANKHEHSGLGGKALEVTVKPGMTSKQAIEECEKMLREI